MIDPKTQIDLFHGTGLIKVAVYSGLYLDETQNPLMLLKSNLGDELCD